MKASEQYRPNRIRVQLGIAAFLSLLCMGVMLWLSRQSNSDLARILHEQARGQEFSADINSFRDSLIITNDQLKLYVEGAEVSDLKHHQLSTVRLQEQLARLTTPDLDPTLAPYVNQLNQLFQEKIAHDRSVILLRMSNNTIPSAELHDGDQLTRKLVALCDELQSSHKLQLIGRIDHSLEISAQASRTDIVAFVIAMVIILVAALLLFQDISKRNKLEKELREATIRAEQSVLLKEQFVANMSHEIRTPLNTMLGFTDILSQTPLSPQQMEHLRVIHQSGRSLLSIINDILDFSKLEAGMMRLEAVPFNLESLLHNINTMFQPRAAEKGIRLVFQPVENVPGMMIGDPNRLQQILVNLVSNAIKFTHEGTVEVQGRLLRSDSENLVLQFTVSDTGIGIPPEMIDHVFDRFYQGEPDPARKYGGTGLGLSIVKLLVELQGGIIRVESTKGKGSTFTFTVSYHTYQQQNAPSGEVTQAEETDRLSLLRGKRVLVAEDNPLNQRLAAELFRSRGMEVMLVANGQEVLDTLRNHKFDVVLMDIQMPGKNGYETAREVRKLYGNEMPIIAVTAHALPGEKEKCVAAGMNDYVPKPLHADELLRMVARHVFRSGKAGLRTVYRQAEPQERYTNLEYLEQLANGNKEFIGEMITLFLSENPGELQTLGEAIEQQDYPTIAQIAHKMQSTIPFVGLNTLLDEPLKLIQNEANGKGDLQLIRSLFEQVAAICRKAAEELNVA